jgi:hypothetical protein
MIFFRLPSGIHYYMENIPGPNLRSDLVSTLMRIKIPSQLGSKPEVLLQDLVVYIPSLVCKLKNAHVERPILYTCMYDFPL